MTVLVYLKLESTLYLLLFNSNLDNFYSCKREYETFVYKQIYLLHF